MSEPLFPLPLGPISPAAGGPLYRQVEEALKREVAEGRLKPGTALPSFRALAEQLLVSLITVKRAYDELEREGVIRCHQGLGTFVAEQATERLRAAHRTAVTEALRSAIRAARLAGMSDAELREELQAELNHKESTTL